MNFFTVVIQSYLGKYKGAAKNRNQKLIRALQSIANQNFTEFETIVIADGCKQSFDIVSEFAKNCNLNLKCSLIDKQEMWSGIPRNLGIKQATGKYIVYLDNDDYFGKDHLKIIHDQISEHEPEWCFYNCFEWDSRIEKFAEYQCDINQISKHGAGNLCHKKECDIMWRVPKYGLDDYYFAKDLKCKYFNFKKIKTPEYFVCHVPSNIHNGGFDV